MKDHSHETCTALVMMSSYIRPSLFWKTTSRWDLFLHFFPHQLPSLNEDHPSFCESYLLIFMVVWHHRSHCMHNESVMLVALLHLAIINTWINVSTANSSVNRWTKEQSLQWTNQCHLLVIDIYMYKYILNLQRTKKYSRHSIKCILLYTRIANRTIKTREHTQINRRKNITKSHYTTWNMIKSHRTKKQTNFNLYPHWKNINLRHS